MFDPYDRGPAYYADERNKAALAEMREDRRQTGMERRMPALLTAIKTCRETGDTSFRGALEHWIASLDGRMKFKKGYPIKIPDVLRRALGLSTQSVILESGSLWSAVDGGKRLLLYTPPPQQPMSDNNGSAT